MGLFDFLCYGYDWLVYGWGMLSIVIFQIFVFIKMDLVLSYFDIQLYFVLCGVIVDDNLIGMLKESSYVI